MISRKLTGLGCEIHMPVSEQDFGLAHPARVEDDLPGKRIAGVVLEANVEFHTTQRNPFAIA